MRGTADNATAFLLLAVVAYAVGTVFALGGLFIRNYSVTEYADRLWSIYKDTDAEELKSSLVESIEKAYPCNERIIRQKAIAVRGVVILLGFEAVFLALDVADFSLL